MDRPPLVYSKRERENPNSHGRRPQASHCRRATEVGKYQLRDLLHRLHFCVCWRSTTIASEEFLGEGTVQGMRRHVPTLSTQEESTGQPHKPRDEHIACEESRGGCSGLHIFRKRFVHRSKKKTFFKSRAVSKPSRFASLVHIDSLHRWCYQRK
jgi:hypothetical protein